MSLRDIFGKKETPPSLINDPFKKDSFTRLYVTYYKTWDNKFTANGSLEFQNGNTKGEQKFDGETFDEVVLKMKNFIDNELEK